MTEEEERGAVRRVLAGDTAAFESVVLAYEKLLYNISLRMLGSPEDAADAVQETFLRAFSSLNAYRGEGKLSGWLCRIAGNICLDVLRRRRETVSLSVEGGEGETVQWDIPDERQDPAALTERKELRERVRRALEELPPDFRLPLLLREYGGLHYDEIARSLDLDPGTVKTRIFRARKKLCAILSADGNYFSEATSNDLRYERRGGGKQ